MLGVLSAAQIHHRCKNIRDFSLKNLQHFYNFSLQKTTTPAYNSENIRFAHVVNFHPQFKNP